jgi:hypothetical protein
MNFAQQGIVFPPSSTSAKLFRLDQDPEEFYTLKFDTEEALRD